MNFTRPMVKVAFETVLYGRRFDDIERALDEIASAGFQGVEFAQSPAMLRRDGVTSVKILLELLDARKLELVALAGGTLRERMDFCGDANVVKYLYVEEAEPAFEEARARGFRLALHPHLFMPVHRMTEARQVLQEHRDLLFLPDTAHLALSGDDPAQAIKEFSSKLAGVHLKDWTQQFGRYSHRYARGFVELGQGIVEWDSVLHQLDEVARRRQQQDPLWLTVELDSSRTTTWASLCECVSWLHSKRGHWVGQPRAEVTSIPPCVSLRKTGQKSTSLIPADKELAFRRRLTVASTKSSATFYQEVAAAYHEILPCHLTQVWIFTPSENRLDLMGRYGECTASTLSNLTCAKGEEKRPLCTHVIDALEAKAFNLRDHANSFLDKDLLEYLTDKVATGCSPHATMLSIPISNTWNAHHIRFVVNLFPTGEMPDGTPMAAPQSFGQEGDAHDTLLDRLLENLAGLSEALSPEADSMLDERALAATGRIHAYRPGEKFKTGRNHFTEFFAEAVRQSLDAEAAAVFLIDPIHDRLELRASVPSTEWHPDLAPGDRFYFRNDDRNTAVAWTSGEIQFLATEKRSQRKWKSREPVLHPEREDCIFAPIVSSRHNEVIGVVRCTNKNTTGAPAEAAHKASRMFTDDDAAVLDAITQVASPFFSQLQIQDEQIATLGKIVHEFQVPLVAIRGAVDLIKLACDQKKIKLATLLGEDFVEDIFQWTELVGRLVNQADVFRQTYQGALRLKLKECLLMGDIVVPAVRQVERLLQERGFAPNAISIGGFDSIPRLSLDRTQMQQVIFNLLSNSIKYAEGRGDFRVAISCHRMAGEPMLRFEDYGPGIDEQYRESIFRPGFRGPGAHQQYVGGQGLGLSVVKAILEAHGGSVRCARHRKPFIIDLSFPAGLIVL